MVPIPRSFTAAALLGALLAPACASSPAPPPPSVETRRAEFEEGRPGGLVVDTVQTSARVVALDRARRRATLRGPDGREFVVRVSPAAVNFDRVEVGDVVTATVTQALMVRMGDADAPLPDGEAAAVSAAPAGSKPGGVLANAVRRTGTVTALDPEARTATLRFADGSERTFPVRPDVDLDRRRVGETVVFQVTEEVAVDVWKD